MVKASKEEIVFQTGAQELPRGVAQLWHAGLKLVVVTLGEQGCSYFTPQTQGHVPGFRVETIDTTGAGDGFVAGLLSKALAHPAIWQDVSALEKALRFANAIGALTTTQLGAIPALPGMAAVEQLSKQ